MAGISDTERLLIFEKNLIGKHIAVDQTGRIPCPLRMWHTKGDYLHMSVDRLTEGNYIPVSCKWCKCYFHISLQRDETGKQEASIQRADISRLPAAERSKLLLSLKAPHRS